MLRAALLFTAASVLGAPPEAVVGEECVAAAGLCEEAEPVDMMQRKVALRNLEATASEGLTCGLEKDSKLMLLLSSSGIRGPEIKASLDEMVSALPATGGKADYSKLKLIVLYDACMLKQSFWNKDDKDFNVTEGMNYLKAGIKNLTPNLVKPYDFVGPKNEMLDVSWCYNEWTDSSATGGLKDFGFASHTPVSIMDRMMKPEEFRSLVHADLGITGAQEAQTLLAQLQKRPVPDELKQLIGEADVIASCGGNPDLAAFVYRAFPELAAMLSAKLQKGRAVYLGRSASSMVVGATAAFSYEPTPDMLQHVLSGDGHGLVLLPKCIIKPHFKAEEYEAYSSALEKTAGRHVLRMPNMAAWVCNKGSCRLQGNINPEDLKFHNSAGHYMEHLDILFDNLP